MSKRKETTRMLSSLVEKRLRNNYRAWAKEVTLNKNGGDEVRVDYIGFSPARVNDEICVDRGFFDCYEVKSCMADFESGYGLNFFGDSNFVVCTEELACRLHDENRLPHNVAILVPNKNETALFVKYHGWSGSYSPRKHTSSLLLWCMAQAGINFS